MSCIICVEKFNSSNRKATKCQYCDFVACRTCCETYLLGENIPKCMNTQCGREWTRQYMSSVFTKVFLTKTYKNHCENVLFDHERSLMPETQPIIEAIKQKEKIKADILDIYEQINILKNQLLICNHNIWEQDLIIQGSAKGPIGRKFVRSCVTDGCRGFLDANFFCGVCDNWTCKECNETKGNTRDAEHTCNPDNVASVALMAKDTKPCPKCGTGIFKIDGCDQMWCTECHTAFSWRTGNIEENIHNPHYYEWMRRTTGSVPRNPADIPGGGCANDTLINYQFSITLKSSVQAVLHKLYLSKYSESNNVKNVKDPNVNIRQYRQNKNQYRTQLRDLCEYLINTNSDLVRNYMHIRYAELHKYADDEMQINRDLRVQYMQNKLTEEEFKALIQRNNKKHQKNREITNLLNIVIQSVSDILQRINVRLRQMETSSYFENKLNVMIPSTEWDKLFNIYKELTPLVEYVNECFEDVSKIYHCARIVITSSIEMHPISNANKIEKLSQVTLINKEFIEKLHQFSENAYTNALPV